MKTQTKLEQLQVRTQVRSGYCPHKCEGDHFKRIYSGMNPRESLCEEHKCLLTCTDAWYSGDFVKYC